MRGYKSQPAATRATLSDKGQLHTGDIGRIDKSGYLYITGRKKDIIITAGAENVAPAPIEETIKTLLGNVGHVFLIGDQRKFLTVLITPSEDGTTPDSGRVERALKEYNEQHARSRAQRVQKAHVVDKHFDVSTGELTPTMKLKRATVATKYSAEIEAMYQDPSSKLVGYSSMNIGSLESAI